MDFKGKKTKTKMTITIASLLVHRVEGTATGAVSLIERLRKWKMHLSKEVRVQRSLFIWNRLPKPTLGGAKGGLCGNAIWYSEQAADKK